MQSITITSDDALFPAVLAMMQSDLPGDEGNEVAQSKSSGRKAKASSTSTSRKSGKGKAKPEPEEDDEEEDEDLEDDEESEEDEFDEMNKRQLRAYCKKNDIEVKRGLGEDELREIIRDNLDSSDEEDEEDEDDEEEDDDDGEIEIEVGMKVKAKIKGRTKQCVVKAIDYDAGKVKVKAPDGKLYRVTPEDLDI